MFATVFAIPGLSMCWWLEWGNYKPKELKAFSIDTPQYNMDTVMGRFC